MTSHEQYTEMQNQGASGDEGIQEPQPRSAHCRNQHQRFYAAPGEARPRRDDRCDPGADQDGTADAETLLDPGRVQALCHSEPLGGERGDESCDQQGGLAAESNGFTSTRAFTMPSSRRR